MRNRCSDASKFQNFKRVLIIQKNKETKKSNIFLGAFGKSQLSMVFLFIQRVKLQNLIEWISKSRFFSIIFSTISKNCWSMCIPKEVHLTLKNIKVSREMAQLTSFRANNLDGKFHSICIRKIIKRLWSAAAGELPTSDSFIFGLNFILINSRISKLNKKKLKSFKIRKIVTLSWPQANCLFCATR